MGTKFSVYCGRCKHKCFVTVEDEDGKLSFSGNHCSKGKKIAAKEAEESKHVLEIGAKTGDGKRVRLVTDKAIKAEKCKKALKAMKGLEVDKAKKGQVVCKDLADTGVAVKIAEIL